VSRSLGNPERRRSSSQGARLPLGLFAAAGAVIAISGCAAGHTESREEAAVRALVRHVASDGRRHQFDDICSHDMVPDLRELATLSGTECRAVLATEWDEGVQLTSVGGHTRIALADGRAEIFDGPVPDRAIRRASEWRLAEFPRNKRLGIVEEACRAARSANAVLTTHHLPALAARAELGCGS
jgi:hypothetical protein